MAAETLNALEFPGLLRIVQSYAASSVGQAYLAALRPLTELAAIQEKFSEIRELQDLESRAGDIPLGDFPDLAAALAKARVPGSLLPPQTFNDILHVLRLTRQVRLYLAQGHLTALARLASALNDLTELKSAITGSISPHNFILDGASPELARVRRELGDARGALYRQIKQSFFGETYQHIIQTPTISQRHGRYVIPVKADHKGVIPGIIHDASQTRATLFLEPLAIVEQNNTLNLLVNQEKREEEKILRRLTDQVRVYLDALAGNVKALGELDAIAAKVRFARAYGAREPVFMSTGGVEFRQARHPLLLAREKEGPQAPTTIPTHLELTPEKRFLVISGANAGGKTVALKTLGLLTLMVQSGIPVPVAEGSVFSPFHQVFADIGDTQDLHQNLSTFSAHLKKALGMLNELSGRALVLLDELGTATDPTEGGALALALLQAFYRRGAYGAVTTHLPVLKNFAQREAGFENVAVVFDEKTRRPTYHLSYGVVGSSNALTIARQLGLDPAILAEAEGYLDAEELKGWRLLAEVEGAKERLHRQEEELEKAKAELAAREEELVREREKLAAQRERFLTEEVQAVRARIREAESEFKEILGKLQQGEESWGRLRQELSSREAEVLGDLTPAPPEPEPEQPEYTPGQRIFLPALNLPGEVLAVDKHGRLTVRVRQVKMRARPEEVTPLTDGGGGEAQAARPYINYRPAPTHLPSLNLVGLRVEEALPLVDRLLDQAILQGAERVDIIHGTGTGRLKKAVREHLKHHTMVKAVHGDVNPGVTLVDLKD
uniref:Endonuclease MutS2 n=1 Tax=Desulfobacca acetoxidans TaxID=60893 RepID=A0A7V6DR50_9BACT